jgi:hypothetical protein
MSMGGVLDGNGSGKVLGTMVGCGICDIATGWGVEFPGKMVSFGSIIYDPESILNRRGRGGAVTSERTAASMELNEIIATRMRKTTPHDRTSPFPCEDCGMREYGLEYVLNMVYHMSIKKSIDMYLHVLLFNSVIFLSG